MFIAAIAGFSLGISFLLAIGAQNAFVLRQGLRGEHGLLVASICAFSDVLLISLGVFGAGAISNAHPYVLASLLWFGVAFLVYYGAQSFVSAFASDEVLVPSEEAKRSVWGIVATALILTWANPHVYLDTVILLGALSSQFDENAWAFGVGAAIGSFVWFFGLVGFATALRPYFKSQKAWRTLDVLVALTMWTIASLLAFRAI